MGSLVPSPGIYLSRNYSLPTAVIPVKQLTVTDKLTCEAVKLG